MNRLFLVIFVLSNCLLLTPPILGELSSNQEIGLEVLWEANSERFKVVRPYGKIQAHLDSESGLYDMGLSMLAWGNGAADVENKLDQSRFEARSALCNLFLDSYLVSIGQMIVDWGETFGYRPSDLVNARDFRNFSPIDLDANKIPITALRVAGSMGALQGEMIYSPLSSYPLLPKQLADGSLLHTPARNETWFEQAEYGFKAGVLLDYGNIDFFAYRHLNRLPVLSLSLQGWHAQFESLSSFGINSAFSRDRFVLRMDGIISPKYPLLIRTFASKPEYASYSSLTVGFDLSSDRGSLLGLQTHLEHYPIQENRIQKGVSMQARHDFWNCDTSLAISIYRGFVFKEGREEIKLNTKAGSALDLSIGGERTHWGNGSPMAVAENSRSYSSKIAYQF